MASNINCEILHDRTVNFAMQQNHIPVVKRLRITNIGDSNLTDLKVKLTCIPEFANPWETIVASIPLDQTVDLGVVDLQLSPSYLASLSERIEGRLVLSIHENDVQILSSESEIAVLAFDEWNGSQTLPEIIAAFATPNHPEIAKILRKAADILKTRTGDASLNGYQSKDPLRIRNQLAAIYTVLQQENIAYIVPPASFEEQGQKIRMVDTIQENRIGTCLDLTLLYASCAEAAGLHPFVIITKGHAFPGAWLVEESFSESIQDDLTLLSKRIDLGIQEVCVIESTAMTANNISFDEAVIMAEDHLRKPEEFLYFVDIHRARIGQIRPLPIRTQYKMIIEDTLSITEPTIIQSAEIASNLNDSNIKVALEGERTRLDQWERRLLDLSLRNQLLNFKVTTTSIPLLTIELNKLEDNLAAGMDFKIYPRTKDWEQNEDSRDRNVFQHRRHNDPMMAVLQEEFQQNRLRADLSEKDLSNRLTQIYRAARTSIEENGANTLYLALGLLEWYESDVSQKPFYAPIILLPMEIIRQSVQNGYIIRERDDEPQLNVTLLEMLRQDHGINISGLDPLPKDDSGIDLKKVFTIIRQAVKYNPRWELVENAYLGLFSFNKFMMWYDLKNRTEELKKNKIVSSLIAGHLTWAQENSNDFGDQIDKTHPKEIICPISADSSQLAAIMAAGEGHSMVLHGPPGTGKSQTITNIIAYALSQGKTVLFVAEKMAALTVVQRRLQQIGLAPFCLEVHSNKSKKKDVLDQLAISTNLMRRESPQNWLSEAERLRELRDDLNKYVEALHIKRTIGHSFFQAMAISIANRKSPDVVKFTAEQVNEITDQKYFQWTELVRKLRITGEGCGHPYGHVWSLSRCEEYLPQARTQLADALNNLLGAIEELQQTKIPLVQLFTITEQDDSFTSAAIIYELAQQFLNTPPVPGTMVQLTDWDEVRSAIDSWINHGQTRDKLKAEILNCYNEQVLKLDVTTLQADLQNAKQQWLVPRFFGMRKITKTLKGVLRPGASVKNTIENDLEQIRLFQEEDSFLKTTGDKAREIIGSLWQDGNADWESVSNASTWAASTRKLSADIAGADLRYMRVLRENWAQLISDFREQLRADGIYGKQLNSYIKAYAAFTGSWQQVNVLAMIDQELLDANKNDKMWFTSMKEQIQRWQDNLDSLRDWCAWRSVRTEAIISGLLPLVEPYEMGKLSHDQLESSFKRGFYQAWIENELAKDNILSSFNRGLFEDKIDKFRKLDDTFAELTRQETFARLSARLPDINGEAVNTSELGILQREILKQRGHMAIRQVFSKIPNLLSRLKPCMLMSPISVAQYLDPSHPPFDLVIFDEASQVPTCDAVGAIARGKDAIVVGDPKQLPPTSFFMRMQVDDEDDEFDIQDLESILDDCLAIRMPEGHLRWHYRSQHESLISFSNYQYYNNSLLTFPSPDDLTPAVQLITVSGYYDRGKSKQNRSEAEAIVAEVTRRLKDPELSKSTIGIVTFSQVQQRLIEDLLDEQIRHNPEIESFFTDSSIEPVFVKNLENVQGDERDVILFSIGYGPDAQGRISYNFGPLNRDSGWRRLNVAVSRARQEMLVFSTLRPDQLDLSKNNTQGVADLKAFLEFAERGKTALYAQRLVSPDAEYDSLFEEQVSLALQEKGYTVHAQVGCSGYRIDLAILDSDKPGRYLIGIECDGATYHRSKTARDRDKLREMVLRQLGWEIHRIWSTDWWENPQREIMRVEQAINEARKGIKKVERQYIAAQAIPNPTYEHTRLEPLPTSAKETTNKSPSKYKVPYKTAQLPVVNKPQDEFYFNGSNELLLKQISLVIEQEGPVSYGLICRRVAQAWGMNRVGSRIDNRIKELCSRTGFVKTTADNYFYYWPIANSPLDYDLYRVPNGDSAYRREIIDIPIEEIKNAAFDILRQQISLPEEDLIREISRAFGYQRLSASTAQQHLAKGIGLLLTNGKAKREQGQIVLE